MFPAANICSLRLFTALWEKSVVLAVVYCGEPVLCQHIFK